MSEQTKDKWDGTRFVYITNLPKIGPVTAAYRFNDADQVITFEFARCSKRDTFSKKIGRGIAFGRLKTHPQSFPYADVGELTYPKITAEVVRLVTENVGKRRRAA